MEEGASSCPQAVASKRTGDGAGGVSDATGAGLFANGDGCGRVMGCAFGYESDIGYMCEGERWISIR